MATGFYPKFEQNLKVGDLIYTDTSEKHGEFGIIKDIIQIKDTCYEDYNLYTYEVVAWETGKRKKCKDLHTTNDCRKFYSMRGEDIIKQKIQEYEECINNLKKLL